MAINKSFSDTINRQTREQRHGSKAAGFPTGCWRISRHPQMGLKILQNYFMWHHSKDDRHKQGGLYRAGKAQHIPTADDWISPEVISCPSPWTNQIVVFRNRAGSYVLCCTVVYLLLSVSPQRLLQTKHGSAFPIIFYFGASFGSPCPDVKHHHHV